MPPTQNLTHRSPLIPILKGIWATACCPNREFSNWAAACCLIGGLSNCETACCAIADRPDCAAACCTIGFVPVKNQYHWRISSKFLRKNHFIPSPSPDSPQLTCSAQILRATAIQIQPSEQQSVRRSQSRPLLQQGQHSAPV